jgi:hypothetical protein
MAYPDGLSLAVITSGNGFTATGGEQSLKVTMTPVFPRAGGGSLKRIVHEPTGWVMSNASDTFTAPGGGSVSFSVPHVDQAGFRDPAGNVYTGWHYLVKVTLNDHKGKGTGSTYEQTVRPIMGQSLIDLDLVPAGDPGEPSSVPAPAVTSVNGITGGVNVDVVHVGDGVYEIQVTS